MRSRLIFLLSLVMPWLGATAMPIDECPQLTGKVVKRGDAQYDHARLVSNYYASKESFPEVIVYCQNSTDVQNAIKWARCNNIAVRVRSGGHNHEGYSTASKAIVIDVSQMKQLHLDKEKKTAIIQPGLTGGELYTLLHQEGLTQVGGTCADVGISGLILTGGMGPLLRRHGLACDNVLAIELVDANSQIIQATKDNAYKDLFWALCGAGGGNFGVVTALTLQLFPATPVTWFNIGWDWKQPIAEVISGWQDFFLNADRRWFSHLDLWSGAFSIDEFQMQPIKVLGVFWGTAEEARQQLTPLLTLGKPNTLKIEQLSWLQAIKAFEESTTIYTTEKPEYKSTGAFAMQKLPAAAIEIIIDTLQKASSPSLNVLLFSMGGATQEIPADATAYYYRQAASFITYSNQWLQEGDSYKYIEQVESLRQKLLPYTQGDYVGNPDRNIKDYLQTYYGANLQRLRSIKRKYDPLNLFSFEQSIPLALDGQVQDGQSGR